MIYFVYCSAEESWDAGRVQSRLATRGRKDAVSFKEVTAGDNA